MRLNNGGPVWHASISAQSAKGLMAVPDLVEADAVRCLAGVGGEHEWWLWNPAARVGHLRVPVTSDELAHVPPGCAIHDAGESGPQRPRTRR